MASPLLQPLLATMSKAARAAWPFIQRGVREGLGANAIQRALREAGMGIRRQDLLALVREATGAQLVMSDLRRLPRDLVIPVERVRQAATKIVGPISYTLRVIELDVETGAEREVFLTAHSERMRPFAEIEQSFLEADLGGRYGTTTVFTDAEVVDVVRSGPAGLI